VIIRCERCATAYELEDGVLPLEGSDVQCARCQHVFRALPPQAAAAMERGVPPEPAPLAPMERTTPAPAQGSAPSSAGASPSSAARRPTVYRPPISQPAVARAPVLRRDTVGTFESRLRWSHRWRWLAPALLVVAAAIGGAVYSFRDARAPRETEDARARALALALADDVKSLEDAAAALQRIADSAPLAHAARADRALVELLLAGALSEPEPRGPRRERARALTASASATLDDLARANLARPEVARARAVAAVLSADRAEVKRLATAARAELPGDVFVLLAEHGADVRAADRSARDRALDELELLLARRPELVRARYLLAKGLALAGRRDEALAAAEEVLRRNPRHEGALGLREAMTRPPPTAPIAPPGAEPARARELAAAEDPAPQPIRTEKPGLLPRKPVSTEGQVAPSPLADPAPEAALPAGPAGPTPAGEEPPPPPRLRPAAVPEPEVVEGGG
jgi:predicted Zn finger-like uncharacterized protein